MGIIYTYHAEGQIQERHISKDKIEFALMNPDKITESRAGTKIAQKQDGSKLLRVVYKQQNNTYIIITAYYTSSDRY